MSADITGAGGPGASVPGGDVIVVGAGQAAAQLCLSLRAGGVAGVPSLPPALVAAARIVIVGGGYIGLEVAAVMRQEGRGVMVLEAEDRLLKRVTGTDMSAFFETLHRERGVDIRLGARLAALAGEGAVTGLRRGDGSPLAADAVLAAHGAKPNQPPARR